ncbi:MAG: DUF362 domain-containing protein [Bacillota bacterium]
MASKVYLTGRRAASPKESLARKVDYLFERVGAARLVEKNSLVAVKVHFGERGSTAYVHPVLVNRVVERIKEAGGKPFLCDTNTLYAGGRSNAVDHLETALRHGFSYATVGAPLVIADGLRGRNYHPVPVGGKHLKEVRIAAAVVEADAMIVLSHVKGHMITGFGGAIKNLGMGCGNRTGKQQMHSALKPVINADKCKRCGACVQWCLTKAVTMNEGSGALINPAICTGCGECIVSCTHGAVQVQWRSAAKEVGERMAEYARGAVWGKEDKSVFLNFLLNVIPDCDCCGWSDAPIVPDIGILASTDAVAIDQASVDLVNNQAGIKDSALKDHFAAGEDKFYALHPESNYDAKLAHAAELGLGSRDYELIK